MNYLIVGFLIGYIGIPIIDNFLQILQFGMEIIKAKASIVIAKDNEIMDSISAGNAGSASVVGFQIDSEEDEIDDE